LIWPEQSLATILFVIDGMIEVAPLVIPGILVSAWVNASGAGARIKNAFEGNKTKAIFISALVGAVTPVCGITVLPLMAGLLASGVPLAPVMAFWLSSPVTDPAMFAVTAATLGYHFAVFKTLAAFGIGIFGGLATAGMRNVRWTQLPLRQGGLAAMISVQNSCAQTTAFTWDIWNDTGPVRQFWNEVWAMTKLIVICLGLAFAAEFLMQSYLHPEALSRYVGSDTWWAIPLAVFVGSPAYLDGYAALPLTRGLIDHGMSLGAAMAFLVSGSVVSIWGALAIFPVLKTRPFMLYLFLAITGSLTVGWIYEYVT
jgi:uncharacterized membrane protein YraQ (UPF0718 family)